METIANEDEFICSSGATACPLRRFEHHGPGGAAKTSVAPGYTPVRRTF